jgi:hypothetical protein
MRDQDIQLCDSCGRYLFLAPVEEPAPEGPVNQVEKPAPKKRKRKAAVAAAV